MATKWMIMTLYGWDSIRIEGLPITPPPGAPTGYMPVFDTEEQAKEFAPDAEVRPIETLEDTDGR